jgi:hypothetical protein
MAPQVDARRHRRRRGTPPGRASSSKRAAFRPRAPMMAGLLAHGSDPALFRKAEDRAVRLPSRAPGPVARDEQLTAYSCGGSRGVAPRSLLTRPPDKPGGGTIMGAVCPGRCPVNHKPCRVMSQSGFRLATQRRHSAAKPDRLRRMHLFTKHGCGTDKPFRFQRSTSRSVAHRLRNTVVGEGRFLTEAATRTFYNCWTARPRRVRHFSIRRAVEGWTMPTGIGAGASANKGRVQPGRHRACRGEALRRPRHRRMDGCARRQYRHRRRCATLIGGPCRDKMASR